MELMMFVSAARDYFKEHLSLGDHWAGGIRKQNLTKNPLSTVNFISTRGETGEREERMGHQQSTAVWHFRNGWGHTGRKREGRRKRLGIDWTGAMHSGMHSTASPQDCDVSGTLSYKCTVSMTYLTGLSRAWLKSSTGIFFCLTS